MRGAPKVRFRGLMESIDPNSCKLFILMKPFTASQRRSENTDPQPLAHPAENRRGTLIGVPTDSCGAKTPHSALPPPLPPPLRSLGKCFPAGGHDDGPAAAEEEEGGDASDAPAEFARGERTAAAALWPIRSGKGRGRRGRGSRPNGPSTVAEKFVTSPSWRRGPRRQSGRPPAVPEPAERKGRRSD